MKNCFQIQCCGKVLAVFLTALFVMVIIVIIREPQHPAREFLGKCPGFSQLIKERNATQTKAQLIELQMKQPVFDHLIKFIFEADRSKPEYLNDYLAYYRRIIEFFPETSDAYGVLGYCYFYLGDFEKSREAFFQARNLNKKYFWYSYDLGMVNFKLNNVDEAQFYLKEAYVLGMNGVDESLQFIPQAQVFQQIFRQVSGLTNDYLKNNLAAGYRTIDQLQQNHWEKPADIQLRLF